MGICNECKHHRYTQLDLGRRRLCGVKLAPQPSGHWCMNEKKQCTDYVTGETFTPDCYRLNAFGECLDFEKIEDETEEKESGTSEETAGGEISDGSAQDGSSQDTGSSGGDTVGSTGGGK